MDKTERLINLTAFLLDTTRPVTFEELGDTVYQDQPSGTKRQRNALHKMFERDKDELREMGIDVEVRRSEQTGDEGYIIPRDKYYLPHLDLQPEEKVALTMVSRLFLGSGTPFSGPAHSALLKLAFEGGAADDAPRVHWVESSPAREALGAILEGLMRRKVLSFSYQALDAAEPAQREVEPYGLFSRKGYWYVVGRCRTRRETRSFKLDRIVSKVKVNQDKPRSADFEVPRSFCVVDEARWKWPASGEEGKTRAVMSLSPRLAFARRSGPAEVHSEKQRKDGTLEVTYEVADPEQFMEWALGFGMDARILAPEELREMVKERLTGALESARKK
jgi:proteasome accessory factor B